MSKTFTLKNNQTGEEIELPVLEGTMGPNVIDIQKLYAQTGHFTFDPGFTSTASCESGLTYIDGGEGQLEHRGYDIFELAEKSDYLTVCYLLLYGELPSAEQKKDFDSNITRHTMLHEQLLSFFKGYRRGAHPMAITIGVVGALSAFYHDSTDINDPEQRELATIRMLAKMPTIGACAYKYSIGQPFIYPDNRLSFAGNLLKMLFAVPTEDYELNPVVERAMDRILMLHADHEQNASTSTVRLAASSQANPFACFAAGIASLWGPAHGGANQAVLEMLEEIGDPSRVEEFVNRAKNPDDSYRLMGFGHRVYKNFDPRAKVMRETAHEVLAELGIEDSPELEIAMALEKIALEDEYFIQRKLYPNVDFYSGIILSAIGFPTNMFTVVFAIGRSVGWIAHWKEMMRDNPKIGRPRQLYTGPKSRAYVDIDKR